MRDSRYLNVLEDPLIIRVSHYIIHGIWRQPNVDLYIEVTQRTFWYTDLSKVPLESISFVS